MNNKILAITAIALAITLTLAAGMVAIGTLTVHQAFAFGTLTTPGETVTFPEEGNSHDAIGENVGKGAPCEAYRIDENPITASFGKIGC